MASSNRLAGLLCYYTTILIKDRSVNRDTVGCKPVCVVIRRDRAAYRSLKNKLIFINSLRSVIKYHF